MNPFMFTWMVWLLLWMGIAFWSKRSARREGAASWLLHMVPLMLAFILLSARRMPYGAMEGAIVPYQPWFYGVGLALTVGGCCSRSGRACIWAATGALRSRSRPITNWCAAARTVSFDTRSTRAC